MNVLSLFDGMSCGQLAINRVGLSYDNYFASEVDKYAMKVTMANFPNTIQIGDVREVKVSLFSNTPITLMMGGSPCQSFSFAGKRKGMSTKDNIEILSLDQYLELKQNNFEFEGQSYLFWEYIRLLNEVKPKYFLLENVMMEERWEKVITKTIGVHPLEINSSLVSAQNRRRLYWTNIGLEPKGLFGDLEQTIVQPKEKGILLKDILEDNPNAKHYLSKKMLNYLYEKDAKSKSEKYGHFFKPTYGNKKAFALRTKQNKIDSDYIIDEKYYLSERMLKGLKLNKNDFGVLNESKESHNQQPFQQNRIYDINGISPPLQTQLRNPSHMILDLNENQKNKFDINVDTDKHNCLTTAIGRAGSSSEYMNSVSKIAKLTSRIRRLTPVECERLQTVPDNYTNHVSDSQRYKMLGNGWTIDVIAHILKHMK